ncbi:MAG: phage tail protein [Fervidobacterium sp.]|nr:phage tail protein [Fervidobacterium sp.]
MANFGGTILTTRGRNLLAKALTGTQLQFTRIGLGDGVWDANTNPETLTALVSEKLSLQIQSLQIAGDGTARLRFVLTNQGLQQGFFLREIGIFARDPDLGEILYAVTYASNPDFIPAAGLVSVENVVDIYTVVSNAQNITAVISDTVILATKQDIQAHNSDSTAHADIRDRITQKILAHNTSPRAHQDIRDLLARSMIGSGIDLTNATSDYFLQVGEKAIIRVNNETSKPLRIATQSETAYRLIVLPLNTGGTSGTTGSAILLYPNNTTYSNAFYSAHWHVFLAGTNVTVGQAYYIYPAFGLTHIGLAHIVADIVNTTQYKSVISHANLYGTPTEFPGLLLHYCNWRDTTTPWTSLGTIAWPQPSSAIIIVERIY